MDKTRSFFKQFNTLRYWFVVILVRAIRDAAPISKVKDKMMDIIISLIVASIFVAIYGSVRDASLLELNLTTVIWVLGATFVFRLIVAVIRIPAEMDKEKQEEIYRGKQQISKLQEDARPKLELSYDDAQDTSHQAWSSNFIDFRVIVKNIGSVHLENLTVKLIDTKPKTLPFLPVELNITHDYSNSLNPSDSRFVDVLETRPPNKNLVFSAKGKGFEQYNYPFQDYEILLAASADNSPVATKWFKLSYDPSNRQATFVFKELPDFEG